MLLTKEIARKPSMPDQSWSSIEAYGKWLFNFSDVLLTGKAGGKIISAKRRQRLQQMISFARQHSKFYRKKYAQVPLGECALHLLPPVTKPELMQHFDDWVTDPAITRAGAESFIADEWRIGRPFLGRYALWSSSGTTGTPGIFVHDADALSVYDALSAARFRGVNAQRFISGVPAGAKLALIAARGQFAGAATWQRLRQTYPQIARTTRVFSVTAPLAELVNSLNRFDPAYIASYPTVFQILAQEKHAGRLQAAVQGLWSGGEWLPEAARADIERIFGCPVIDEYGASEFMNIAFECAHRKLHLNSDWVWLEPVDEKYRPVPAGKPSATVLLTNLANRVQPFIRYDLGDSVTLGAGACRCGSAFPLLHVEGRRDEILTMKNPQGRAVALLPLALSTALEEHAGVHHFQVIQTAPATLAVRFAASDQPNAMKIKVRKALKDFLAHQGLPNTRIRFDGIEPKPHGASGKFRRVWSARP